MKHLFFLPLSLIIAGSCSIDKPLLKGTMQSATISSNKKVHVTEVVDFQKEFLKRINKARSEGCKCGEAYMPPVDPLTWNYQLELSALGHAQDMARNRYFSHVSKNGDKIKNRITASGYTHDGYQSFSIGENIAYNQRTIKEVMEGWLKSPGHCKNIMSPAFKEVGISMKDYYWVQDFGGRLPFSKRYTR